MRFLSRLDEPLVYIIDVFAKHTPLRRSRLHANGEHTVGFTVLREFILKFVVFKLANARKADKE